MTNEQDAQRGYTDQVFFAKPTKKRLGKIKSEAPIKAAAHSVHDADLVMRTCSIAWFFRVNSADTVGANRVLIAVRGSVTTSPMLKARL